MRWSQDMPASRKWFCRLPSSYLRLRVLFQWFFTALSVRPARLFAISAHLFPVHCTRMTLSCVLQAFVRSSVP